MAVYDIYNLSGKMTLQPGDIINCPYSGNVKTTNIKGKFKIECWGASGGSYNESTAPRGGYSQGILNLANKLNLYLYVGGKGGSNTTHSFEKGGYNGGGAGSSDGTGTSQHRIASSGGGATDVSISGGECTLDSYNRYVREQSSYLGRIIVAGGGGGNSASWTGGAGGGLEGKPAQENQSFSFNGSGKCYGGQTYCGGLGSWCQERGILGGFGYASGTLMDKVYIGGGGGWYGGGASVEGGGGGSGYVYTSSTASNYPSGCLLDESFYLDEAETLDGTNTFLSPEGTNETGHIGDGYIRLTAITKLEIYVPLVPRTFNVLTDTIPEKLIAGDVLNCAYDGNVHSVLLPKGIYKLECWGAKGIYTNREYTSTSNYGKGAYVKGVLNIKEKRNLYLAVGASPHEKNTDLTYGGYNGGGADYYSNDDNGSGGGATHISLEEHTIDLDSYKRYVASEVGLYSRIIVAGGGGSGRGSSAEQHGGYFNQNGSSTYAGKLNSAGSSTSSYAVDGGFGKGVSNTYTSDGSSGGGGGWYGGGTVNDSYSGGGSSYAWCEELSQYAPSGYTPTTNYYLTEVEFASGQQTMPNYNGGTMTGNDGNGYIRITVIKASVDYEGHKLDEPTPDYHITDDLTLTPPAQKAYRILRSHLIYDRTQGDIVTAYNIPDNKQFNKGNYNYTDLNRVEMWCEYMSKLIRKLGFADDTTTFKTDWKIGDLPSKEELDRIKNNVIAIRNSYFKFADTPTAESLNEGKNKMNFTEANNMEKIIYDLFIRLYASRRLPRKCGVFNLGQNFIWQQRFRYNKSWETVLVETFNEFDENDILDLICNDILEDKPVTFNATSTIEGNIKYLNDYYETIDQVTGYIYVEGDNPKYYWFNGDYKSLLQKTLQGGGIDVQPPTYEGETPTLEDIDYAIYCYYDDDDEEIDRILQKKQFTFTEFNPFEADPLVPKELDDVEGTIKVADFDITYSSKESEVIPEKEGYEFDGWEKVIIDEEPNDYNFKPKWREIDG